MITDRGSNGRNQRLRSLDTESYADFVGGFRDWVFGELNDCAKGRAEVLLESVNGQGREQSLESLSRLFESDPVIRSRLMCWISSQQMMWRGLTDHFDRYRDEYLAEMEAAEQAGDCSLEINPELQIPDYAKHEIHLQPGGYLGNPLAGAIFLEGSKVFFAGYNDLDQMHISIASNIGMPAEGPINKIVDFGCGPGQLTLALKERFESAQVWGLDVSAPMVRYAHARSKSLGVATNFAQRLAEDSKFEKGTVDIASAFILFHEVPHEAAREICAEAFRILRQGGAFTVVDFHTGDRRPDVSAYRRYMAWADHKFNAERWSNDFLHSNFEQTLSDAGFDVSFGPDPAPGIATYIARKQQ